MRIPMNKKQINDASTDQEIKRESGRQLQMTLGKVTEVDDTNMSVKVRLVENGEMLGYSSDGDWFHIINSWEDLKHRFGDIKNGFWVRVWWKGDKIPKNPWVEIIADDSVNFFKSSPPSDGKVGAYKIFSPGVL